MVTRQGSIDILIAVVAIGLLATLWMGTSLLNRVEIKKAIKTNQSLQGFYTGEVIARSLFEEGKAATNVTPGSFSLTAFPLELFPQGGAALLTQVISEDATTGIRTFCGNVAFKGSRQAEETCIVQYPAPTVTLTSNPPNITSSQAVSLSWITTNADTCELTNLSGGGCLANSSKCDDLQGTNEPTPTLTATTDFQLRCVGKGGITTVQTTVALAPSCGSPVRNFGGCWYAGTANQSCDQICASRGGTKPTVLPNAKACIDLAQALQVKTPNPFGAIPPGVSNAPAAFSCGIETVWNPKMTYYYARWSKGAINFASRKNTIRMICDCNQ